MANSKGPSSVRNVMHNGKHSLLPPKSPFPSISPLYADYVPSSVTGAKSIPRPRDGNPHHQRTSSESFLIEDQPSWLDELLNEPETPLRRGHRRASSDSFAYMDAVTANMDYAVQDEYRARNLMAVPSWTPQDLDYYKDARHASFYSETNSVGRSKNRTWDSPVSLGAHPTRVPCADKKFVLQNSVSSCDSQEAHGFTSTATEKKNAADYGPNDVKASSERKDLSYAQASVSKTDTKYAKQQFAQRSRVRKLQYIAELERNVQALEIKGSEVSAELEFLNQKNLILSMENEALKRRLENVAQEQRIKYLEHEVLEKEIGRLRALYQQQQLPPQQKLPSSTHRRTSSRDLNSQFAGLSLKNKESSSSHEAVSGPLHI